MRALRIALLSMCFAAASSAQPDADQQLARVLSNPVTRSRALEFLHGREDAVLLLLSWTEHTPYGLDPESFNVALADAFRDFKAVSALPFLIRHISTTRYKVDRFPS